MELLEAKIVSGNSPKQILSALKALSDETRVRILHILSLSPLNVQEITEVLKMGQSRVSRHLKILTDAGFLIPEREGSWVYYRIIEEKKAPTFSSEVTELLLSYKEDLPFRTTDQAQISEILSRRDQKNTFYFNNVAHDWESIQKDVLDPAIYRKKILSYLPDFSSLIYDLGCGPGGLIPYLLTKSDQVIGIDASPKMVEEAEVAFTGNAHVSLICSPLENVASYAREEADAVVASMVLHHLSNPPAVIREIYKILKPGGTFCLVDLKKHNQEFMRDNFSDLWLGFDYSLLQDWLELSGFRVGSYEEFDTGNVFKILIIQAKKKED
ncbi:ArsR/SmtB family transcription factor [Leptospira mayottensis]|uniref:Ribosomal protein L11 methyltransferase-like protein n=2 Tax=Leptospira mayottensis TaxID=1137606 RepID=A0AA87MPM8_9LEPT|nr:metalloregulator ArsR/SmtB family transcription factor [Leptospira mayottensis]AXR66476.1 methyltransferase domain-containing protein [Leptospira mayottensis]EKS00026.1 ribosomal protein L11 methyltransferase-like protein [Leptospira mayottensis 200901122]